MKNKKAVKSKKLTLKKEAIAVLNSKQMSKIVGGGDPVWVTTFTSEPVSTGSVLCGG